MKWLLVTLSLISLLFFVSFTLNSAVAWPSPKIVSVERSPEAPNYSQPVTIMAKVNPKARGRVHEVESVILMYKAYSTDWIEVSMSLEDSEDCIYVAEIPAKPYNSQVIYKVCACDIHEHYSYSNSYFYEVSDFVPPVISSLRQVPSLPRPDENVTVSVIVTEPPEASGVKKVTLFYKTNKDWLSLDMNKQERVWSDIIPGQNEGVNVKFFVKAFDKKGNSATSSIVDYSIILPNDPPVANFTESADTVYIDEVIDFDASESYDPDGSILSYFWDFGDGITRNGVLVQHSYSQDGKYVVTLTVTDSEGAANATSATKTVQEQPSLPPNQVPVASFTESGETVYVEESINFDASGSYDPDGSIVSYSWDFGDGTTATGVTVSNAYIYAGSYTVTLTVTDNRGATNTASVVKTVLAEPVLNHKPVASFTESDEIVYIDDVISFNAANSYDPDGTIVSYHWDFGDGITGTGLSVSHSYSESGTYVITLTVTDDDGVTNTATAAKGVLVRTVNPQNHKPVASFTESAETVYTGESIFFDGSGSIDPDGDVISYLWNFGDGNTAVGVETDHKYGDDGTYIVTFTVIDNDGATDSTTSAKNVLNRPPITSFTGNATKVTIGEAIQFDASHSNDPDGIIVSYFWDFGDKTNATGVTLTHTYEEGGNYTIILTVTDDDGSSALENASMIVKAEEKLDGALFLSFIGAIGLGVTAFTITLLYGLVIRRKRRRRT
jgi:PKD repeat protein